MIGFEFASHTSAVANGSAAILASMLLSSEEKYIQESRRRSAQHSTVKDIGLFTLLSFSTLPIFVVIKKKL